MYRPISSQELLQLGSTWMGEFGPSQVHMGIVSPCSACNNQRTYTDDSTQRMPPCPRRTLAAQAQAASDAGFSDTPPAVLLCTGSGDDSSNQLVNPVHSQQNGAVLIWVATLADNQGVTDDTGNILAPNLLDPDFDSTYIVCKSRPFVPDMSQAYYNQHGVFKESDRLLLNLLHNFQLNLAGDLVQVSGFARKVDFVGTFSFLTPASNTLAVGC